MSDIKTIAYNEQFEITVMLYDGDINLERHTANCLTKYGIPFEKEKRGESGKYGDEWHYTIICKGIQQAALAYIIIGGSPMV